MWNLELIWYFEKETKTEAIKLEKMIKRNWHIDHRIIHKTFVPYGGCSSVGRAADCDSACRGFDPRQSPH